MTPRTIFGNWFSPFSLRQVLAAAMTSLKTISRALSCDSALGAHRPVPHRGEDALDRVRGAQVIPVLGGKVAEGQRRVAVLDQARHRFLAFGRVLLGGGGDRRLGRCWRRRASQCR